MERSTVGQPSAYLLPWEEQPLGCQGMSARIGVWDRATAWGKEVCRRDVWVPQEMGAGDEESLS